jgi:hypothetical protein
MEPYKFQDKSMLARAKRILKLICAIICLTNDQLSKIKVQIFTHLEILLEINIAVWHSSIPVASPEMIRNEKLIMFHDSINSETNFQNVQI